MTFRDLGAARAGGYVLAVATVLVAGGSLTTPWIAALCWSAMAVGMVFFTGVALSGAPNETLILLAGFGLPA